MAIENEILEKEVREIPTPTVGAYLGNPAADGGAIPVEGTTDTRIETRQMDVGFISPFERLIKNMVYKPGDKAVEQKFLPLSNEASKNPSIYDMVEAPDSISTTFNKRLKYTVIAGYSKEKELIASYNEADMAARKAARKLTMETSIKAMIHNDMKLTIIDFLKNAKNTMAANYTFTNLDLEACQTLVADINTAVSYLTKELLSNAPINTTNPTAVDRITRPLILIDTALLNTMKTKLKSFNLLTTFNAPVEEINGFTANSPAAGYLFAVVDEAALNPMITFEDYQEAKDIGGGKITEALEKTVMYAVSNMKNVCIGKNATVLKIGTGLKVPTKLKLFGKTVS